MRNFSSGDKLPEIDLLALCQVLFAVAQFGDTFFPSLNLKPKTSILEINFVESSFVP